MSVAPSQNQPASATPDPGPAQNARRKGPGFNVYTAMLILAFLALSAACLIMYIHLSTEYGNYPWWNTSEASGTSGTSFNTTIDSSLMSPGSPLWRDEISRIERL